MRWDLVLVTLLVMASSALGQAGSGMSKLEVPDVYDFGYPETWTPRYEHDPKNKKRILNPDFFCTACAAEGRIDAKSRDEMAQILEVDKRYPTELEGKIEEHFGAFRLFERPAQQVLDKLFSKAMELENPIFIEDGFFRLFIDLPSFSNKLPPLPRREFLLQQLADVFPDVSEKTITINPHHRAHLYLYRANRVREEFINLVGHDDKAAYSDYMAPYLGMRNKYELYVFEKQKHLKNFVLDNLGQTLDDGLCWHLLTERAMQTFQHGERRKDMWIANTFIYRLSYSFIAGYRGYAYDIPAWLALGFGHLMERRERTDFNTFIFGEGRLPDIDLNGKWRVLVKKAILADKARSFAEFAHETPVGSLPPHEHPIAWSLVSYLVQLDQKKFGQMIHVLKEKKQGENERDLIRRALTMAYGLSLTDVDTGWREWVKATYPSN